MAQCLRYELKPRGLSVACFCPGEVETPGLAEERKTLHPAATALKKIGGTMPLETAVRGLIEGIRRDDFMIIPGFKVQLIYWLHRLLPDRTWNAITDALVAQALQNMPAAAPRETAPA
jgi:short-subunit dehydrogenase